MPLLRRFAPVAVGFALPIAIFAFVVPARHALAEQADKKQPINYSANTGDVNYQTKVGNLSGNVVITQGTMTIRADKIVFKQNADNSISATAFGNPITFRQKRDGVDEYFEGYAQRAEYDGEKELLELFDRALLRRGLDEIRSNYISYNTRTELFRAEGRPDAASAPLDSGPGARVRGTFQPPKNDGKDNGNADPKAAKAGKDATAKPAPLPLKRAGEIPSGAAK
jgi:lipopolysaccharide export system protein LptA